MFGDILLHVGIKILPKMAQTMYTHMNKRINNKKNTVYKISLQSQKHKSTIKTLRHPYLKKSLSSDTKNFYHFM
jgi:hypothetical protein